VVCQQILPRILRPERESASGGYSAKLERRPVRIKDAVEYVFLDVVELSLTAGWFLRHQMVRFFLLSIDNRLGSGSVSANSSSILREGVKRTGNRARDEKHGELSDKSNSHRQLS
jgi:hypothetical protein